MYSMIVQLNKDGTAEVYEFPTFAHCIVKLESYAKGQVVEYVSIYRMN